MRTTILLALLAALLAGCEHADPTQPDGLEPTLTSIEQNIFTQNCALSGCHAGSNPQQGMDLSPGEAYDNIVGVASREKPDLLRVDPGNPDQSYLVMKIEGAPGIVGQQMPLGRTPLSQNDIDVIREWIADGAPRD